MRTLLPFTLALLALSLASTGIGAAKEEPHPCTPSFREVTSRPIVTSVAGQTASFSVALIGCKSDLDSLAPADLKRVADEFRNPTRWNTLATVWMPRNKTLRSRATARVNELLGRRVVSDVLITDTEGKIF